MISQLKLYSLLILFLLNTGFAVFPEAQAVPLANRFADVPPGGFGYPFITNITPDQYNAHVQNWGFAADDNGILFTANLQAVLRYNGVEWEQIRIPGNRCFSILAVEESRINSKWDENKDKHPPDGVRIFAGGLGELGYLVFEQSADTPLTPGYKFESLRHLIPDTITFEHVWRIAAGRNGVVFYTNFHLFHYDGNEITVHTARSRFSAIIEMDGDVYVRESQYGLKKVSRERLIPWHRGDFFSSINLRSYFKAGNGTFFCSYYECYRYESGEFQPFVNEASDYLKENFIDEARVLSDGTIVIATRNGGIVRMTSEGHLIQILNEESGLISNTVYSIFEDNMGSVWAATINGIARIDFQLPLYRYDQRNGLGEAANRTTVWNGLLFVSTSRGVYMLDSGGKARYFGGKTFCHQFFHHKENLYVVCSGSLYHFDGRTFNEVAAQASDAVAVWDDDIVVMAHEVSLSLAVLNPGSLDFLYHTDEVAVRPNSIVVCPEKNIWIGTDSHGLIRIELKFENREITGHSVHYYLQMQDSDRSQRVSVTTIGGNPVFLATGKGLQQFDPESGTMSRILDFGPMFSEPDRQILLAEEDASGNVWFRSGRQYQAALLQDDGSYAIQTDIFRRIDDRQINAIYPDENGQVWFATERGLVRYDTKKRYDTQRAYLTSIGSVFVRSDSLVARGPNKEPLILEYNDNELRFTYAAASYLVPDLTEYRVMLDGFDRRWSAWTTDIQKDYTNIPEGRYAFFVEAKNVYGVISASYPFHVTILSPWYRTWWAYILYFLTSSGILFTVYRIRVNQILRLHKIRNAIASDLHDEISATLSSISFFARAIEDDRIKGDKSRFVNLISESAGSAKEKITDIVWAINPENDDWASFLSKCRRFASDLLESKNINYELHIDQQVPGTLGMQQRQNLWLIFKELVTNTVRHSEASNVEISLRYKGRILILVVDDDGIGMDPKAPASGSGLENIRRRIGILGGTYSLDTAHGRGTRWMIRFRM